MEKERITHFGQPSNDLKGLSYKILQLQIWM